MTTFTPGQGTDPSFVRKIFSDLASNPSLHYRDYRWHRDPIVRLQYEQSRRTLLKVLSELPPKFGHVLEVGGGDGMWTPHLTERSHHVDFLDISPAMIAAAKHHLAAFPAIHFIEGDLLTEGLAENKYDLVMLFRCFEYMADKAAAIQKCTAALCTGGSILIVTKNPAFKEWGAYFGGKKIHSGQIAVDDLKILLKKAGLVVQGVYPATLGTSLESSARRSTWNAIHSIFLALPFLMPASLTRRHAESFLIYAQKRSLVT